MYLPSFRLDNKHAIVTGAGRGIGKALAIGLAEAGADVALLSRTEGDLRETAEMIRSLGKRVLVIPTDVTLKEEVLRAVSTVEDEWGEIHILINNAGMNIRSKAIEVTEEEWQTIMDTNLKSAFMMSQQVGKVMQKHGIFQNTFNRNLTF